MAELLLKKMPTRREIAQLELERKIKDARGPHELGRLLADNKILTIGVHVFYEETTGAGKLNMTARMRWETPASKGFCEQVQQYHSNVLRLLCALDEEQYKHTILFCENPEARERTQDIVAAKGITGEPNYYWSALGELNKLPPNHDENALLAHAIRKGKPIFAFGMYVEGCLHVATYHLNELAHKLRAPWPLILQNPKVQL